MSEGMVFNIQRYSIHDGPGIRTTVFLKGCPLDCWWCHNPESKQIKARIVFQRERCLGCRACEAMCEPKAIVLKEGVLKKWEEKCTLCGKCQKVCPSNAWELIGKSMKVQEVMKEIERDITFYDESKGGVTFSGGEPLIQLQFLYDLLEESKKRGIHTAVDTSGYSSWDVLDKISKKTDLFLFDIKHMKEQEHKKLTGVSNTTILENVKKLTGLQANIMIRFPIIPGLNDGGNIRNTAEFVISLGIKDIHILPYHNTAVDKYNKIGEVYKISDILPPEKEYVEEIAKEIRDLGLRVKIGG